MENIITREKLLENRLANRILTDDEIATILRIDDVEGLAPGEGLTEEQQDVSC